MIKIEKVTNLLSKYPLEELSMLTGKMLGDGGLSIQDNRRPRFRYTHCITDFEWSQYCFEQLQNIMPLNPPIYKKTLDPRIQKGYTESFYVQSLTCELNDYFQSIWYQDRVKVIPFDLLEKTLTPECIAWWYQDDGHLRISQGKLRKIILSTDSFTNLENTKLIELIKLQYGLCFSLDGQNRLILYDQIQIYYFLRLIEEHVHPSMSRKLFLPPPKETFADKRTTIYLPASLLIKKPTKEIHNALERLPRVIDIVNNKKTYFPVVKEQLEKQLKLNEIHKGYQVTLTTPQLNSIHIVQSMTGMQLSLIVKMCFNIP
ncbi:endonuclease [Bacillus sp. V59.32b]|uniref:endonuclease n=1 Tax=Bacillus sp. V59.32b TaxID=1758642 RepID=UPI000E3E4125|nr:endonuclease [Bacillus sp. V59.32b]RFU67426.1 endonuclease [Bacillus sp. V59.32b]